MSSLFVMRPNNFCSQGLLQLINKNFKDKNSLIGLQIGSYAGESAQLFLSTGKFEELYCVDPWTPGYDDTDLASKTNVQAQKVFDSKFSTDSRVHKIKGYSYDTLPKFADEFFDFIYIDGNHQFNAVSQDILKALPKLKADGVIAGHDYACPRGCWKCVTDAVNTTLGRTPEFTFSDYSWSIHKYLI